MSSGKVLLGVLAGAAAGALLGVLLAPEKGSVTRDKLAKMGDDATGDIADKIKSLRDTLAEKIDSFRDQGEEMVNNLSKNGNQLKNTVKQATSHAGGTSYSSGSNSNA